MFKDIRMVILGIIFIFFGILFYLAFRHMKRDMLNDQIVKRTHNDLQKRI